MVSVVLKVLTVIRRETLERPETHMRWHRVGFRRYWRPLLHRNQNAPIIG
jgi:hypothetical protein